MKTPFAPCALPESETPETRGPRTSAPFPSTRKFAASPTALAPSPSAAALFEASAMPPPFSESAEAPMPSPFASSSAPATV